MTFLSTLRRSGALAAMAAACAAPAGFANASGDIVKCVASDGKVTLTDGPCSDGSSSVIVPAARTAAPDNLPRPALVRTALNVAPIDHDNWIDPRPAGKMFSRDAATLRAARTSLQVLDEAASSARQQRMASR